MEGCGNRSGWVRTGMAATALLAMLGFAGCGAKEAPPPKADNGKVVQVEANTTTPTAAAEQSAAPRDPKLDQPFADATLQEPVAGAVLPPLRTITEKSVGKLYDEVVAQWENIRFRAPGGKAISYVATLETGEGNIEISLRPDLAPNHVRSFLALSKAGYYEGLVFERTVQETIPETAEKLELIEGGCPIGTGELGYGSIGYWLKPEFTNQAVHEEGTVGASHGEQPETAACKFYITMNKARSMDGNYTIFGKVTKGMDVAHKIFALPRRTDSEYPDGDRPVNPVVIRKVTIQASEGN